MKCFEYVCTQISGVCASGGMKPVSLDDPALANELVSLVGSKPLLKSVHFFNTSGLYYKCLGL
jgi:hypothetical protein